MLPNINSLSQGITNNQNSYYYLWPYYPTRFDVTEKEQIFRQNIWSFKDGMVPSTFYKKIGEILKEIIDLNFEKNTEVYLCIIPASTSIKTSIRFFRFCNVAVENSNAKNGFDLIMNKTDREATHIVDPGGAVDVLKYITIKDVLNKQIILVDDVITRGRSYDQLSNALQKSGAKRIVGFFIGRTTHKLI